MAIPLLHFIPALSEKLISFLHYRKTFYGQIYEEPKRNGPALIIAKQFVKMSDK